MTQTDVSEGMIPVTLLLGILPGTAGANKFGTDPLNPDSTGADEEYLAMQEMEKGFQVSVEHLKKGKTKEALAVLKELLEHKHISARGLGAIQFNIAVCHRRSGNDLPAANALKEALQHAPKLARQARKDEDLLELFDNKEYRTILNSFH